MTAAQQAALDKVQGLLHEHFDRSLLVVDYVDEPVNGQESESHQVFWHGGRMAALGMTVMAEEKLMQADEAEAEEL